MSRSCSNPIYLHLKTPDTELMLVAGGKDILLVDTSGWDKSVTVLGTIDLKFEEVKEATLQILMTTEFIVCEYNWWEEGGISEPQGLQEAGDAHCCGDGRAGGLGGQAALENFLVYCKSQRQSRIEFKSGEKLFNHLRHLLEFFLCLTLLGLHLRLTCLPRVTLLGATPKVSGCQHCSSLNPYLLTKWFSQKLIGLVVVVHWQHNNMGIIPHWQHQNDKRQQDLWCLYNWGEDGCVTGPQKSGSWLKWQKHLLFFN